MLWRQTVLFSSLSRFSQCNLPATSCLSRRCALAGVIPANSACEHARFGVTTLRQPKIAMERLRDAFSTDALSRLDVRDGFLAIFSGVAVYTAARWFRLARQQVQPGEFANAGVDRAVFAGMYVVSDELDLILSMQMLA